MVCFLNRAFHLSNIALTAGRTGKWTEDEDLKLKYSIQLHGGKDWKAIATLVPGRARDQCRGRWHDVLDPSIAVTVGRRGTWTADEDSKLKTAMQIHGGKDWKAIAALVQGRTNQQCYGRWHDALDPSIALTAGRTGRWTADEDSKLKVAVQMQGSSKDWKAIATLVPTRSKCQCKMRWYNALDPSIALTAGRTGKWTADEDSKLKVAVQMHGGKDWKAIATLVQGRTERQCCRRWHNLLGRDVLDPSSIAVTAGRTGI
jgi:myb proto-oncogene protein